MRLHKANDRKKMYFRMMVYLERREKLRDYYGIVNGSTSPKEYKDRVRSINKGIERYKSQMKRIDKRNVQIIAIANSICYFSGINVKNSVSLIDNRTRLMRNIFYKYCLENNISATLVAEYVGASRGDVVARGRLNFTASFTTHPENKQTWLNFKDYITEEIERISVPDEIVKE